MPHTWSIWLLESKDIDRKLTFACACACAGVVLKVQLVAPGKVSTHVKCKLKRTQTHARAHIISAEAFDDAVGAGRFSCSALTQKTTPT